MWGRSVFAGGLLALGLFGGATAGQFEDAQAAYQHGDYATAMRLWRLLGRPRGCGGADRPRRDLRPRPRRAPGLRAGRHVVAEGC